MRKEFWIDVRTPKEFRHSHVPFAYNFPVLSDEEHHEVGLLYRKDRFEAKRLGSSYICQNIARFLDRDIFHPKHKLILYCARGGQRSKSLWLILREIGFDAQRLEGGYKGYRQSVLQALASPPSQHFFTLYGMTGSGKSELIALAREWSLDLEGLSGHYGSSFGDQANGFRGQGSQAMFENRLFEALRSKSGLLLIEGESKKMGKIILPNPLFGAMHSGFKIQIQTSLPLRVERIVRMYSGIQEEHFLYCLKRIERYIQKCFYQEVLREWEHRNYPKIAAILLEKYYDRVYRQKPCDVEICGDDVEGAYMQICDIAREFRV